jgi:hypothetical protein
MKMLIIKSLDQCITEGLVTEIKDFYGKTINYDFSTNSNPGLNYNMLNIFGKQYIFEKPNIRISIGYYRIVDPIYNISWIWPKEVVIETVFEFKKIKII